MSTVLLVSSTADEIYNPAAGQAEPSSRWPFFEDR